MERLGEQYDYNFKLKLQAEWFDPVAQMKKFFVLGFYPVDASVELYDINKRKIFLRRAQFEGLCLKDIYVGNTVNIYDRSIKITDYADNVTRDFIGVWKEHTIAVIKPSGMPHLGDILNEIYSAQYTIDRFRMVFLSRPEAAKLYSGHQENTQVASIIEHMASGPNVVLELVGKDVVAGWKRMMGPFDPMEAKKTDPNSFRARYGIDLASNAVYGADTVDIAANLAAIFFPQDNNNAPPATTAHFKNSTCCVIKPHAINEGKMGHIINAILGKFQITAIQMFILSQMNVDELLEVYKGVVADFNAFLRSFVGGPCIALEISAMRGEDSDQDVHQEFRMFCGPLDSDIAKQIRPTSLRGRFGTDKYRNAVHCTDLPEDAQSELEYFFKILDI